jgi:hypothetical protein
MICAGNVSIPAEEEASRMTGSSVDAGRSDAVDAKAADFPDDCAPGISSVGGSITTVCELKPADDGATQRTHGTSGNV